MSNAWPGASCIMWESLYCSIAVSLIPIAFACNYNYSYAGLFIPDTRLLSAEVILGRSKPWFIRFSMIKIESILKRSWTRQNFFLPTANMTIATWQHSTKHSKSPKKIYGSRRKQKSCARNLLFLIDLILPSQHTTIFFTPSHFGLTAVVWKKQ